MKSSQNTCINLRLLVLAEAGVVSGEAFKVTLNCAMSKPVMGSEKAMRIKFVAALVIGPAAV